MPASDTKRCLCCGQYRALSQYRVILSEPDSRAPLCGFCEALEPIAAVRQALATLQHDLAEAQSAGTIPVKFLASAARRDAAIARYVATGGKRCSACHAVKPITDYHRCASRGDGLQAACAGCITLQDKLRRAGQSGQWRTIRDALRAANAQPAAL